MRKLDFEKAYINGRVGGIPLLTNQFWSKMARIEGKYPTKALWIFREGEKTEKNYFSKLRAQERIRRITTKVVNSDNTDAKGVVEHAIAL